MNLIYRYIKSNYQRVVLNSPLPLPHCCSGESNGWEKMGGGGVSGSSLALCPTSPLLPSAAFLAPATCIPIPSPLPTVSSPTTTVRCCLGSIRSWVLEHST